MVFFIQFVTLRCFLFPLPPQTRKKYLRGREYMGLCCWRDCSALANDHLHSCHTRSQDQHWPPFPFQAGHHCSPAFCQCTCVPECISAFPIASSKTASQYLDYEGRVNFHHSRGHGQTVWVLTSPPIRGAGDHDSLSAGSLLTTIICSLLNRDH